MKVFRDISTAMAALTKQRKIFFWISSLMPLMALVVRISLRLAHVSMGVSPLHGIGAHNYQQSHTMSSSD
jgi:hypothetical protein